VISSDIERALDNPFWSSLATRHAHLALGGALARRYPVDVSPFAGMPDMAPHNLSALEALVEVGDDIGIVGPVLPALPGNWTVLRELKVTQMVRTDRSLLPEGGLATSILGAADVEEILALVEATRPGPFRPLTIELGTYLGARDGGRADLDRGLPGSQRGLHPSGSAWARVCACADGARHQPDAAVGADAVSACRERQSAGDRDVPAAGIRCSHRVMVFACSEGCVDG
jgi:hypothetical protein